MSLRIALALGIASAPLAASATCSPDWISASTAEIKPVFGSAIELQLTIENTGSYAIGGAIVNYTVTAPGRPSDLASGPSQFAHTLQGGLLGGEFTTLRDVISLSEHAANIVAGLADPEVITVEATVVGIADAEMRPIGGSSDPFQLWQDAPSSIRCDDGTE